MFCTFGVFLDTTSCCCTIMYEINNIIIIINDGLSRIRWIFSDSMDFLGFDGLYRL